MPNLCEKHSKNCRLLFSNQKSAWALASIPKAITSARRRHSGMSCRLATYLTQKPRVPVVNSRLIYGTCTESYSLLTYPLIYCRLPQKVFRWHMDKVHLISHQHSSAKQTAQSLSSAWSFWLWVKFSQAQRHSRNLTRPILMILIGSWTHGSRQSRLDHAHLTS